MADRKARYERRQQARGKRAQDSRKARRSNLMRTALMVSGGFAVVALAIVGIVVLLAGAQKELPPTDFGPGHSELLPPTQINTQPIPRPIQEHVMEHVGARPGILVQYNCVDYQCEAGLVQALTEIVKGYPPRVFLAPYPRMDAKIALAAPGRLLTLESLDEDKVRQFIKDNLNR